LLAEEFELVVSATLFDEVERTLASPREFLGQLG